MNKQNVAYLIFIIITLIIASIYLIDNTEYIHSYFLSFLVFYIVSILLIFVMKKINISWLFFSLPISILLISIFFKFHFFPELIIIALNRIILLSFTIMNKYKKIKIKNKIKIIYINTIVIVVIVEIFLRIFFNFIPIDILKRKNEIIRLLPGQKINNTMVNKQGFLGKDFTEKKKKERWVFIGDSFGVGIVHYNNNFIKMCEDSFDIEAINLSQPGFSPYDYYNQLIKYYDKIDGDKFFIILFTGNDITEWFIPENNWSIDNWRLINFFRNMYYLSHSSNNNVFDMKKTEFINTEIRRSNILINENGELWNRFYKYINKIAEFLKNKDANFTFIIIPDEYAINEKLQLDLTKVLNKNINWQYAHQKTVNYCKSKKYRYLDSYYNLKKVYNNGKNPYKLYNTHINETGNYVIFSLINDNLSNNFFDKK